MQSWALQLRHWQREAFEKYKKHPHKDFLCNATPGAGKTLWAMRVVHYELHRERARRVLVVAPTEHIKYQWEASAATVGIHLDAEFRNSQEDIAPGYHGAVVTYAQVANKPELYATLCRRRAIVFLDECHHASDNLSWGVGIQTGFEHAVRRISLSGTAFRSDGNPIPFIRYDEDGVSISDYVYGYAHALTDGIVRPLVFPSYNGKMTWKHEGEQVTATFTDEMTQEGMGHRLRTAINPGSGWSSKIIADANHLLDELRDRHPDAAGLIIAEDQEAAREIARLTYSVTGHSPVTVISDDPASRQKIAAFERSVQRWIVAVRMITEGVDIPRLRVGVFLTNITSELFFRQAVGRVIRQKAPHPPGDAYFFIPKDPRLVRIARAIERECRHAKQDKDPTAVTGVMGEGRQMALFEPLDARAQGDSLIVSGRALPMPDMTGTQWRDVEDLTLRERRKQHVNNRIRSLVTRLHHKSQGQLRHPEIYRQLNRRQSVSSQDACSMQQLQERELLLRAWILRF